MSVLVVLILVSLAVGLTFLSAFIWSVRSGQYEDTLTPSMRVLLDDAPIANPLPEHGIPAPSYPRSDQQIRRGDQPTTDEINAKN